MTHIAPASEESAMTAAPRRSIREAQKELTRDRLLDAAQEAFEEHGYVGVTIDDIIRRAVAARGTFYLYFESKVAIFQAVLDRLGLRQSYSELVARQNAIEKPSVDSLQAWFEDYVDIYQEHRAFHRAIHEARSVEPDFAKDMLRSLGEDIAYWRPPALATEADSEKLRLGALMNYIKTEGILHLWLVQGVELDRTMVTRMLAEQYYADWYAHAGE
jgi:AcrR family transcriptional regulator